MTKLPTRTQKKIVIIDGYSFVFRAYYSMPALSRPSDGTPVGAVYGFTSMLMRLLLDMEPSHVVVVFDAGSKNHRHKLYPDYKAHRPPAPEDLVPQFPLVREAAKALNIRTLEQDGYEADDIIATLAKEARQNKEEVVIVSSDKDLMQLVNDHTLMYDAMRSKVIGEEEVREKFGVMPALMGDLLALVGDAADNIPGVPGIGPKNAADLLNTYGSLKGIIQNAEQIKQPKRRSAIIDNEKLVLLSRQLVALEEGVKLDIKFDDLKTKSVNSQTLIRFLHDQNFKSLIVRAEKEFNCKDEIKDEAVTTLSESCVQTISDISHVKDIIKNAELYGQCSFYLQTNFKSKVDVQEVDDIHGIAMFINKKYAYYVPLCSSNSIREGDDLFSQGSVCLGSSVTFDGFVSSVTSLLEDPSIKKVFYNYKMFLWLLRGFDVKVCTVDDVMMMSYSIGSGLTDSSLNALSNLYLNRPIQNQEGSITKLRGAFEKISDQEKAVDASKKAFFIYEIFVLLKEKLQKSGNNRLYYMLDKPLSKVVSKMEVDGIKIDAVKINSFKSDLEKRLRSLSEEIYKIAGFEFNIASTQQLSDVLFNKMSLKSGKKSKAGHYSTGVGTLEELHLDGHHIASLLLEWRKLYKLKTTYTDSLLKEADANGRVHTRFLIAYTSTGRFSSVSPNLQNIPIKSELGNEIRGAFVASKGYKLVSADYSQVELRILADIANVPSLKNAFLDGRDVHKITASEVFNKPYDDVTPELRRKAKIINFSIIYGVSSYGLAKNLGIPMQQAKEHIEDYFKKYPGILEYMEDTKLFARKHGYVKTIMGRKCFIKKSESGGGMNFLDRAAINAPIQGSNADIIRRVMGQLDEKLLKNSSNDVRMLLQVHDELLFEIKDDDVQVAVPLIKGVMEGDFLKGVPLVVDINISSNWIKN